MRNYGRTRHPFFLSKAALYSSRCNNQLRRCWLSTIKSTSNLPGPRLVKIQEPVPWSTTEAASSSKLWFINWTRSISFTPLTYFDSFCFDSWIPWLLVFKMPKIFHSKHVVGRDNCRIDVRKDARGNSWEVRNSGHFSFLRIILLIHGFRLKR